MTKRYRIICLAWLMLTTSNAYTQALPPLFKTAVNQIAVSGVVASFPEKTFLENLVLLPDNDLLVNSHYEGIVYKIKANGDKEKFAQVNGKVTGIAAYGKDHFVLSGNDENDKPVMYLLDTKGKISLLMRLPAAQFLNGVAHLNGNNFLVADSYKGCIWKVDVAKKTAAIFLEDNLLKRGDTSNPTPAANGIKVYGNTIYISNTQNHELLTTVLKNGKAEKPKVYINDVNIDDFIVDEKGVIYATTHVYNSVIKITKDKQLSIIATQAEGVSGSTACVIKNDAAGGHRTLYVSTNGGMYYPPPTGIEASKIISLQIQ